MKVVLVVYCVALIVTIQTTLINGMYGKVLVREETVWILYYPDTDLTCMTTIIKCFVVIRFNMSMFARA